MSDPMEVPSQTSAWSECARHVPSAQAVPATFVPVSPWQSVHPIRWTTSTLSTEKAAFVACRCCSRSTDANCVATASTSSRSRTFGSRISLAGYFHGVADGEGDGVGSCSTCWLCFFDVNKISFFLVSSSFLFIYNLEILFYYCILFYWDPGWVHFSVYSFHCGVKQWSRIDNSSAPTAQDYQTSSKTVKLFSYYL